jgi:GTP cyclohydrolase FolE2
VADEVIEAETENFESIHNHSAYASIEKQREME